MRGSSLIRRLTWYSFHVGDYRADTRHLTPLQHFAYRELIDEIFWSGQEYDPPSIADDDAILARIARATAQEWTEMRPVLIDGALLATENGRITQKRMTAEVRKALDISVQRRGAARQRWDRADEQKDRQNAATGVPRNGNGHMSRRQYLYKAGEINKWRTQLNNKWVGAADSSGFERDFLAAFGMTWQEWKAEIEYQASDANA